MLQRRERQFALCEVEKGTPALRYFTDTYLEIFMTNGRVSVENDVNIDPRLVQSILDTTVCCGPVGIAQRV